MSESLTAEHDLVESIKQWTEEEEVIGDDCAILPTGQLITADTLVEGTHFLRSLCSMSELGWKAMAVNLSDIAAMAGRPKFAIVCLTLPEHFDKLEVEKFYRALIHCGKTHKCRVIGGDLTRGPVLTVSITVIGDVHENGVMRRNGARAGDVVVASGDFGASAAGLWLLQHGQGSIANYCVARHNQPSPRLCDSWFIIRQTAGRGAMMDTSDGLADALLQIARQSDVGMLIDAASLPIADATRQAAATAQESALNWALYGGEDYELVACLRAADWKAMETDDSNPFRKIGIVVPADQGVQLQSENGELEKLSLAKAFQHWTSEV